tara:strand:+ start:288 stop:854 length:567 start_codon:yes stop_codon:yes gene_type:complete
MFRNMGFGSRRRLSTGATFKLGEVCMDSLVIHCTNTEPSYISAYVHSPPAAGVHGCQQLIPFYNAVREGLVNSIPGALRAVDDNTGTQEDLITLRESVEVAQIDAHVVTQFCEDVMSASRIRRNTFHAYVSAWGHIKFGDGTLSASRRLYRRILRLFVNPPQVTHVDVVRKVLTSDTASVEVILEILK